MNTTGKQQQQQKETWVVPSLGSMEMTGLCVSQRHHEQQRWGGQFRSLFLL
jgi:hypothetical protein